MPKAGTGAKRAGPFVYHYIRSFPSKSSPGTDYDVSIKVDSRLDPPQQYELAELTCNCRGWINNRNCWHIRDSFCVDALRRFKAEGRQAQVGRAVSEAENQAPWLPDLRDRCGLPEYDPVSVRLKPNGDALLLWDKHGRRHVPASERAVIALLRKALKRPEESLFYPFDLEAWLADHPLEPVRELPWAPGVAQAIAAMETMEPLARPQAAASWGESLLGHQVLMDPLLNLSRPRRPRINFGAVDMSQADVYRRFVETVGRCRLEDELEFEWTKGGQTFVQMMTVEAFAVNIGACRPTRYEKFLHRLARLYGLTGIESGRRELTGVPDGGQPYFLFDHTLDGEPIQSVALDARSHFLHLAPNDLADPAVANTLVYISSGRTFDLHLHPMNQLNADHSRAKGLFAVAAQLLRNMGLPANSPVVVLNPEESPDVSYETTLEELLKEAPPPAEDDLWDLTAQGRELLEAAVSLQAFAMSSAAGVPAPEARQIADAAMQSVALLLGQVPEPPLQSPESHPLRERGASTGDGRQAVLDWIMSARSQLKSAGSKKQFGPDAPLIFSDEVLA
jgi:hypothetical protein